MDFNTVRGHVNYFTENGLQSLLLVASMLTAYSLKKEVMYMTKGFSEDHSIEKHKTLMHIVCCAFIGVET